MKTHRLKLGQRVVIEPGLLDITGTIIALVSWPSDTASEATDIRVGWPACARYRIEQQP